MCLKRGEGHNLGKQEPRNTSRSGAGAGLDQGAVRTVCAACFLSRISSACVPAHHTGMLTHSLCFDVS